MEREQNQDGVQGKSEEGMFVCWSCYVEPEYEFRSEEKKKDFSDRV